MAAIISLAAGAAISLVIQPGGFLAVAYATHLFLFALLMAIFAVSTLLLLLSAVVGRIAARGGSPRDGDIALAVFASYVIGQFMPLFY